MKSALVAAGLGLASAGCVARGAAVAPEPTVAGSWRGGEVELTLEEGAGGVRGHGRAGDRPFVFVESGARTVAGHVATPDGRVRAATLRVTGTGAELTMGNEVLELAWAGADLAPAGGPLTGIWRAQGELAPLGGMTIAERDGLVYGSANALGRPASVIGWTDGPERFRGVVTFDDESAVLFEARLDGGDLLFMGADELRLVR